MPFSAIAPGVARIVVCAAVGLAMFATPASAANKYKVLYGFCAQDRCADGEDPQAALIAGSDGVLYGTTSFGGSFEGTVFALVPKNGKYEHIDIHDFNGSDGFQPTAKLILDTAGNLYGTTSAGSNYGGIVFELVRTQNIKSWGYKVLYSFCSQGGSDCTDGSSAETGVTYLGASSGALYDGVSPLYGVTSVGGTNGGGVVYRLRHSGDSWTEDVLYNFCNACTDNASIPAGDLVDSNGKLYGTTIIGGASNRGAVFQLAHTQGWKESLVYSFCSQSNCADGQAPMAGLLADSRGSLYGTTRAGGTISDDCPAGGDGCGVLFKLVPGKSPRETVLHAFCSVAACKDGMHPTMADLMIDSSGALYGTTEYGGTGSDVDLPGSAGGVLFRYGADGQYQVLHSFCSKANCSDGGRPNAGVIMDANGALYGTTLERGLTLNGGTVYRLQP